MEVYCFGCGSVLDKSTDRRKLVSTAGSSNRVLLVWKTLLLEKVPITSEKIRLQLMCSLLEESNLFEPVIEALTTSVTAVKHSPGDNNVHNSDNHIHKQIIIVTTITAP